MPIKIPDFIKVTKGNVDEGEEPIEMLLSCNIGRDEFGNGVSARDFGSMLNSIPKQRVVKLLINSLGGRTDEGTAMTNMAIARGNVHTCVIGYAASMGAVLTQGGAVRSMMRGTMLIVHNPTTDTEGGDENDHERAKQLLQQVKSNIVDLFSSRTKLSKKKISDLMDASTALDPDEAKELGFIDEVIDGSPVWNDFNPKELCRLLHGAAVGGQKTSPKKENNMSKITETLARLKLIPSADLSDEAAATIAATSIENIITDRETLKIENAASREALKMRVTNRVQKAIDDKKVKAERKEDLIAVGILKETNLDFLDDLQVPGQTATPPRRGAPAVPPTPGNGNEPAEELSRLRDECHKGRGIGGQGDEDVKLALQNAQNAAKLRELRGHKDLFTSGHFATPSRN